MAFIRKIGDYQYEAQINRKNYPRQSRTFETKADAEKWARLVESEMDRGIFVSRTEAENTTLKEALERYLNEVTPGKKGARQETARINAWIDHKLSSRTLAAVRGADMAKYRDDQRKAGKAENTIRLSMAIISHLYKIASTEWGIEGLSNPVAKIAKAGGSKERTRRFEDDEESRLLKALDEHCRNPFIKPAVQFAIETAMRQGEIIKMRWEHVNLSRSTLLVPDRKNDQTDTIPLFPAAKAILESLPRNLSGKVFDVSQDALSRAFTSACKNANPKIEDLHFHDLRHEATSRLFEMGMQIQEVRKITGHKTLSQLMRYTHVRAEDLLKKYG